MPIHNSELGQQEINNSNLFTKILDAIQDLNSPATSEEAKRTALAFLEENREYLTEQQLHTIEPAIKQYR